MTRATLWRFQVYITTTVLLLSTTSGMAETLRLSANGLTHLVANAARHQTRYLHDYVSDLYLGMPYQEFQQLKSQARLKRSQTSLSQYVENVQHGGIRSIVYQFGDKTDRPLYEISIEFEPDFDLQTYAATKYGQPNHVDEWRFNSQEGFVILVWMSHNKLTIAATLPGTERPNK